MHERREWRLPSGSTDSGSTRRETREMSAAEPTLSWNQSDASAEGQTKNAKPSDEAGTEGKDPGVPGRGDGWKAGRAALDVMKREAIS